MNTLIGMDLGWYGKPSGLASLALDGSELHLRNISRLEDGEEILGWIKTEAGSGSVVAAGNGYIVVPQRAAKCVVLA